MSETSQQPHRAPERHTRSRARRGTTAAVAALVMGSSLMIASPATADETPSPSPTATTTESSAPTVTAAPATAGVMSIGDPLRVSVGVHASAAALAAGSATMRIGSAPLANAAAARAWADGSAELGGSVAFAPHAVDAIAADGELTSVISVPATDAQLRGLAAGTHPVEVTYTSGTESVTTRTVLTIRAAKAKPVTATVVVPITARPTAEGLLDANTLAELTAPQGELTALVSGLSADTSALLAIDPALVASVRALGTAAPVSAVEWLDALQELPNERFALQFADADVTTQFAAGLTEPLQPMSLSAYMSLDNFAAAPVGPTPTASPSLTASPTPGATPSPTASTQPDDAPPSPTLPTTEQLTDIADALDIWWPAQGSVDAATLDAAVASKTAVITSTAIARTSAGHASAGGANLLTYDPALAETLAEAATTADEGERAERLALMNALVQYQSAGAKGAPVFLAMHRGGGWTADGVRATLDALSVVSGVQTMRASELLATAPVQITPKPAVADADHVHALDGMLADEKKITRFSNVLVEPDLLTGRERARVLRLLTTEWFADPDAFHAAVAAQQKRIPEILSAVSIVQPEKVTLVSSGSQIPMFVKNDLPFDVEVEIVARPDDPRLTVTERTPVLAARSSNTRTAVPVTAGISNGDVVISLELLAENGDAVDGVKYAQVSVRADWERTGIVLLMGSGALLIGFGIFRTIRRRRRAKAAGIVIDKPARRASRDAFRTPDATPTDTNQGAEAAPDEENRG